MKIFIVSALLYLCIGCNQEGMIATGGGGYSSVVDPDVQTVGDDWTLLWYDDFTGNTLDTEIWNTASGRDKDGWGNREFQVYDSDNISVENGNLIITAKSEETEEWGWWCDPNEENGWEQHVCDVTSGKIDSKKKKSFKYGKIEARMKVPSGSGMWPAFWLLGEDFGWPKNGEIDVMEMKGRIPDESIGTIHWGNDWESRVSNGKTKSVSIDLSKDFHVYSIIWTEKKIEFLLDGNKYNSVSIDPISTDDVLQPFGEEGDHEFYLIVNLAVGGNFDNVDGKWMVPGSDFDSAELIVDWIRVSEKK